MNRRNLFFIILGLIFLAGLAVAVKLLVIDRQNTNSALSVEAIPKADVFVNGEKVGQTPYSSDKMAAGEYKIKLVPASGVLGSYLSWEAKVKLVAGGLTYVHRDLAASDDRQAGQILWLSRLLSGKSAELAVVSDPDEADVRVDDLDRGKTSLVIFDLASGDHEITISRVGYGDQRIPAKIVSGFRLNAFVKLGRVAMETSNQLVATPSAVVATTSATVSQNGPILPKPYVVVKDTPTGFLRVRADPDVTATEAGRVNPGEKYPILSETTGWVKIRTATSSAALGWVSDQYVEKVR